MKELNVSSELTEVFKVFSEITAIPHGSGNTRALRDYCCNYAKKAGCKCIKDDSGNLIIYVAATPGKENSRTLILQGHLDMVLEKTSDCRKDLSKDGLTLVADGDFISADGTTLGADDGIAIALALSLIKETSLPHPEMEIVFTTDEETGMNGAAGLDTSLLNGRTLLNLDSENENTLWVACAGGLRADAVLPLNRRITDTDHGVFLTIGGLSGGHSGTEIDKGIPNAVILTAEFLKELSEVTEFGLAYFSGGNADNAIPSSASVGITVSDIEPVKAFCKSFTRKIEKEYPKQKDFFIKMRNDGEMAAAVIKNESLEKIFGFFGNCPDGVQKMSDEIDGLVETSLNLGIFKLTATEMRASFSLRSSLNAEKEATYNKLSEIVEGFGGKITSHGEYPAWEYSAVSPVREKISECYKKLYGTELTKKAIHAGLECGIFTGKIKGLDCVSWGPDIFDIHTPLEHLSVSSVERVYKVLKTVISEF